MSPMWEYEEYIRHAQFLEIIEGYPDGYFRPNQCVNRIEAIVIAGRTFFPGEKVENTEELYEGSYLKYGTYMRDVIRNSWYSPFAELFFKEELVGANHVEILPVCAAIGCGSSGGYFFPDQPMSRKEGVEMLFRMDQYKSGVPQKKYEIGERRNEAGELKQWLVVLDEKHNQSILIDDMLEKYKAESP